MPTSGAQTRGSTVPPASLNVRRGSGWLEVAPAASLAETTRRGQEYCQDVKVDYGHVMMFAHIYVYIYTSAYMYPCTDMPLKLCTSVRAHSCQCVPTVFIYT